MGLALSGLLARLISALMLLAPLAILLLASWHIATQLQQDALDSVVDGRAVIISLPSGDVQGAKTLPEPLPAPVAQTQPATSLDAPAQDPALIPPPGDGLKSAPAENLSEQTEIGILPKISDEGVKPWQYYAREFKRTGGLPMISIVVSGVGLSNSVSDLAVKLPPGISLSISPYAPDAAIWAGSARALGHEVLVDAPMEPEAYPEADPGPKGLLVASTPEENEKRLKSVLTRFPGSVGALALPEERFTTNLQASESVFTFLNSRGLLLVLGRTPPQLTLDLLTKLSVPHAKSVLEVAPESGQEAVAMKLSELEGVARKQGSALLVIPASQPAINAVAEWVETLEKKGIILAPVSALARLTFFVRDSPHDYHATRNGHPCSSHIIALS